MTRELEQYFKALADITRLRILNLLLQGDELCVCDMQYVLNISQPNVSRHLAYLKNSSLVLDRRNGSRTFYRLSDPDHKIKKALYGFLHQAFQNETELQDDIRQLQEAISSGSCA